jgi:hypothetical protein
MEDFLKPINKFIEQSGFYELEEYGKLEAIALAVCNGELYAAHAQWLCAHMTTIHSRGNASMNFDVCYQLREEIIKKRSAYSKSFFILVLLFSAVSCLITADNYSRRLSNTIARDHTAVSNQSLSGDNHFLASGYNNNTITANNKKTVHIVEQYENERDNIVAITHAVMLPTLNNHVDARVTIFDPGGPHSGS